MKTGHGVCYWFNRGEYMQAYDILQMLQGQVAIAHKEKEEKRAELNHWVLHTNRTRAEIERLGREKQELEGIIERKRYAQTKVSSNPTSKDTSSSTLSTRRAKRKQALKAIHGDEKGLLYGAWDY